MNLVRFFRAMRRVIRVALAPVCAVAIAALATRGEYRSPGRLALGLALLGAVAAVGRVITRAQIRRTDHAVPPMDGSAGLVAVSLGYALVGYTSASGLSPIAALPVITVAAVAALATPRTGVAVAFFAVATEAGFFFESTTRDTFSFGLRAALVVV